MKRFLLFALVATMFAACTTDTTQDVTVNIETPETLTVSFEDDTRIQLQEGKTVWTAGDVVSVFYRSNANQKWQFQGETGERTAQLKRVDAGSATQTMQRVVIVYPYNTNYYINTETYNVEVSLPAEQTYLADSYGLNGNIMVSSSEYNQFALKSVCGWLKVQLTGKGEVVKSITLKGNNGEQVAGQLYVNSQDATAVLAADSGASSEDGVAGGSLVFDDTILTEVVLNCGEGVVLGAEPTAFYIALPPQTFEKGLTIDIKDSNDWTMTKSTNKAVTIERNTIQPMSPFEADIKPELTDYYISAVIEVDADGGKVIFSTDIAQEANPLVQINYGDGTYGIAREHIYSKAGEYAVEYYFADPITEIKGFAFSGVPHKSITIPNTVTAIGSMAFSYSHYLQSVKFEQDSQLKTIGDGAFIYCSKLESLTIPASVESIGTCVFGGCTSLKRVTGGGPKFRNDLGLLTEFAYNYHLIVYVCPSAMDLENVSFGGLTTTIRWGAFTYCNIIKNVDIWITDIEQHNFIYCDNLKSIDLRMTTSIANDVLRDCKSLESLDMPLVKDIGGNSLCNNASLTYISFGCDELAEINGIGSNNESLQTVNIPSGVTTISNSFNSCPAITDVYCKATTPPTLESSFDSLSADAKIYVPYTAISEYKIAAGWSDFADKIVAYDFETNEIVEVQLKSEIWYTSTDGNIVTPYNETAFGVGIVSNTYENGKGVIKFDGNVTLVEYRAFYNCSTLLSVSIPEGVTTIGYCAFYECGSLESVTIPNSVTSIVGSAFYYCSSLTNVTIPNSVTSIGDEAFSCCRSLSKICCNATTPPTAGGSIFYNCHDDLKIYVPAAAVDDYKQAAGWSDYADRIYTSLQIEIGQM